jgi:two-component system, OmpR family, phosphate regulon sensor histidine kinase PhoR
LSKYLGKILVVDDEEIIRMGCKRILENEGYSVDLAENGQIGLDLIQQNSYDLAFIDLMMPEMGGMELLDHIKKIGTNLICFIITGFATIETAVEGVKKGAYDYLPKPFTPDDLRAKLNRGLEKRKLLLEADELRSERDRNLLECSNHKSRTLTILNCMSEGVIATNNSGQIVLLNPVASKMLRLKKDLIGTSVKLNLNNERLEEKILASLKHSGGQSITRFDVDITGGRSLQPSISSIQDDNGEILGSVTVLVDITEEKKIEKMKSEFVRLVSHELKAPLGAIEGYLNLIVEGLTANNPEKERNIITRSKNKAHNLIEMINDLLDLSKTERKITEKEIKSLDLKIILQETIDFYKNEALDKEIIIDFSNENILGKVRGVYEELSRVFANLISNAIKYTPEKGLVNIKVVQQGQQMFISITDSGIGISNEGLAKIFDEFYRAENAIQNKISGTGLGLSIAKKIVNDHNGFIDAKSKLSEGSTFTVVLPTIKN